MRGRLYLFSSQRFTRSGNWQDSVSSCLPCHGPRTVTLARSECEIRNSLTMVFAGQSGFERQALNTQAIVSPPEHIHWLFGERLADSRQWINEAPDAFSLQQWAGVGVACLGCIDAARALLTNESRIDAIEPEGGSFALALADRTKPPESR